MTDTNQNDHTKHARAAIERVGCRHESEGVEYTEVNIFRGELEIMAGIIKDRDVAIKTLADAVLIIKNNSGFNLVLTLGLAALVLWQLI